VALFKPQGKDLEGKEDSELVSARVEAWYPFPSTSRRHLVSVEFLVISARDRKSVADDTSAFAPAASSNSSTDESHNEEAETLSDATK